MESKKRVTLNVTWLDAFSSEIPTFANQRVGHPEVQTSHSAVTYCNGILQPCAIMHINMENGLPPAQMPLPRLDRIKRNRSMISSAVVKFAEMATDTEVAAGIQLFTGFLRETGRLELIEARQVSGGRLLYVLTITSKQSTTKRTTIALSEEFLSDLPNTPQFRRGAQLYAHRTARRMANPNPMDFYCKAGVPVRIEMEWPFDRSAPEPASYMHVSARDLRNSSIAVVSVTMTHQQYMFDVAQNTFTTERAVVNTIRKAVDENRLTFYPDGSHPVQLESVKLDTQLRGLANAESFVEYFLLGKVYSMGFKQGDRRTSVWIADEADAEYLGTTPEALTRAAQLLEARKWIALDATQEYASAGERLLAEGSQFEATTPAMGINAASVSKGRQWDAFICHAGEDKAFVRPLAEALNKRGLKVWFDELELKIGDSLRRRIDEGLRSCRYGIVILSHDFFAKEWPQWELDGLVARQMEGKKIILPVWHNVTSEDVRRYSPSLSDKLAGISAEGTEALADKLVLAISQGTE